MRAPLELDLATADGLAAQGCAIAVHAGLLLLDLTSLSFCDARGLSALVRIANQADTAGCRLALIAPQPPVAKVLRLCRLDQRLRRGRDVPPSPPSRSRTTARTTNNAPTRR